MISGIKNLTNTQFGINKNNTVSFKNNEVKSDSIELSTKKNKTKTILEIIGTSVVLTVGIILAVKHFRPENIKNVTEKATEDKKNIVDNLKSTTNATKGSSIKNPVIDSNNNANNTLDSTIAALPKSPVNKKAVDIPSKSTINGASEELVGKKFEEEMLKYVTPEELFNLNKSAIAESTIITPEMKLMFAQIKDLQGEEFFKTYYKLLAKLLGYKDCAPKLIFKNNKDSIVAASFKQFLGEIEFDISDMINGEQLYTNILSTLRHELEHFIQFTTIARTEGLGTDAICKANAKAVIRGMKMDKERCLEIWGKPFEEISMGEDEMFQKCYDDYKSEINTVFYEKVIKEKGIILKGTPEAKKAEKYLNAIANYTSVGETTNKALIKDYEDNLLEQEAVGAGLSLDNYFSYFKRMLKSKHN